MKKGQRSISLIRKGSNDLAFSGEPAVRGLCRCSKAWPRVRPLKRLVRQSGGPSDE